MLQGAYYKEWSAALGRDVEFKVYGSAGVPVLAFPCQDGRFYDWENNGMPDAAANLINNGKIQLFCAEGLEAAAPQQSASPRRNAELQEKYFNYITGELAPRILELNKPATATKAPADKAKPKAAAKRAEKEPEPAARIWCVGADLGAYQAVNCRLRRPALFAGAIALSGLYDPAARIGGPEDDLALRNSPLAFLACGLADRDALSNGEPMILCAGGDDSETQARKSTQALDNALQSAGVTAHTEIWGQDVGHNWYWWGREWGLFSERIFG